MLFKWKLSRFTRLYNRGVLSTCEAQKWRGYDYAFFETHLSVDNVEFQFYMEYAIPCINSSIVFEWMSKYYESDYSFSDNIHACNQHGRIPLWWRFLRYNM